MNSQVSESACLAENMLMTTPMKTRTARKFALSHNRVGNSIYQITGDHRASIERSN